MPRQETLPPGGGPHTHGLEKHDCLAQLDRPGNGPPEDGELCPAHGRTERKTWVEALANPPPSRSTSRRTALLLRTDKRGAGELLELPEAACCLGRGWASGCSIDDEKVSRRHAEVTVDRGHYFITDLDSANGTFVNDQRVTSAALHHGCSVRLGSAVAYRFSVVDEDERQALSCLRERGHYDPLTQVYNRRYLNKHLESELAFAERHKTPLSVVLLDIDHFKGVNDAHGHLMGDAVIRRVAEIASEQIRTEDMVARFGGEEFLIVLRQTPVEGAEALAERIRCAVQKEKFSTEEDEVLTITLSAGCASLGCLVSSEKGTLVGLADQHLYSAKAQGRNRVVARQAPLLSDLGSSDRERPQNPEPFGVSDDAADLARTSEIGLRAQAYDELVAGQRLVLGLYYQERCSLDEISLVTGQSLSAVTLTFNEGLRCVREQVALARSA